MGIFFHALFLGVILLYLASTALYTKAVWSAVYKGVRFRNELGSARLPYQLLMFGFIIHAMSYVFASSGLLIFNSQTLHNIDILQPNFASTLSLIAFLIVGVFVILGRQISIRFMGAIVAPLALLFFLTASILFHNTEPKFFPQSVFLWVHIGLSIFGHVAFVFAFIFSLFLIIQEKLIRSKANLSWRAFFPPVRILDDLNYYSLLFGLVFMLSGIFTGVIYASFHGLSLNAGQGRLFWSLITILIYMFLIFSRKILRFKGSKSAWMSIVGFAFVACSLIASGLSGSHVN